MDRKTTSTGDGRNPAAPPPEFDDVVVWAAWLYYVDEMTQAEIAQHLGVSRASVANYLQDARRSGVVTIRVDGGTLEHVTLSRTLAERFGLASASVVPALPDAPVDDRLGAAAARVLTRSLVPGDIVGVAWGRTILAAARAAEPTSVADLTIVQVSGSSASSADFAPELCTTLLANQLGARCVNLHAPAVLSSRDLKERLLEEPSLKRQFGLIRSATKIAFGVGELGPESTFAKSEMIAAETLAEARRDFDAKGVIIGRMIDHRGAPVASPIEDGIVGISLEDLRRVPYRLCAAGGVKKIEAIRAALAGGYATHFVTDSATAEALLSVP
ncbi:sugar-binding transcriptional regulator [Jiella sp. MQZ9-1]|uniref:Sugar-binding transcriptional regulator n=1 Tax=Jiella flava TaxID=2816857 RepID=A0A939FXX4_9HYPH|nr:sugar-binding transcriptional regulator [Jiella flava]MBO0662919.1 sugar-binding transcriptional regulator [Jiella flava]MCD2471321.1 sugar-binding transcriptional regulator [Jiella flava]